VLLGTAAAFALTTQIEDVFELARHAASSAQVT
jgi:hypothetical protein